MIVSACESTPYGISDRRPAPGPVLDQEPAVLAAGHAGQRRVGRPVRRRHGLSGLSERDQLPPLAQPGGRHDRAGVRRRTAPTTPRPTPRAPTRSSRTNSQSYLAHVATRAIILIQADDPSIGLVAFVPVGMSEVSSCMIDPDLTPGYHVAKGEELGLLPVRRLDALPGLPPRRDRRLRLARHSPAARPRRAAGAGPLKARHRPPRGLIHPRRASELATRRT